MAAGNVLCFGALAKQLVSVSCYLLLMPSMLVFVEGVNGTKSASEFDEDVIDVLKANRKPATLEFITTAGALTQSSLQLSRSLLVKNRYRAGLVCQDKGWEFCARWAKLGRSPGSRIA